MNMDLAPLQNQQDPDRQIALAVGLFQDDHVLAREHVDPHALDDHLDESHSGIHGPILDEATRGRRGRSWSG